MRLTQLDSSIIALIVGAIIAFVPNYLMETRRQRSAIRSRWDNALFDLCSEFASTARGLQELCLRKTADRENVQLAETIAAEHQKLRTISERLRLLGNLELQTSVRWIVRHAYAVREISEGRSDPRRDEFPDRNPHQRFSEALQLFYIAARKQLQVINPTEITSREFEGGRDLPSV